MSGEGIVADVTLPISNSRIESGVGELQKAL